MRSTLYSQIANGTQTVLPLRRQDVVLDNSCEILHHRRRLVCAVRNYHSPEPKLYSQTPKCRRPCIHAHTRSRRANTHENTSEHITHIHARARAHTHTRVLGLELNRNCTHGIEWNASSYTWVRC